MLGSRDDVSLKMKQHQDEMIKNLQKETAQNKDAVIRRILDLVVDVKPELHINYKPDKTN